MVTIKSKEVSVNCPIDECFDFLIDMNNYELLLPEDKITDWKSSKDQCYFKIMKTYPLELIFDKITSNEIIHLKSGPSSPFSFTLDLFLNEIDNSTKAQLICEADLNPFLKLLVEKPINHLFDFMAERLAKIKS